MKITSSNNIGNLSNLGNIFEKPTNYPETNRGIEHIINHFKQMTTMLKQ
ncbi:MAG: hypothetical protein N4A49_09395 [Marinifilaceae bacterium]|jgi:hypothetical protein|nr:hypothetical protein [Marinifilaceae bacterium]